MAGINHEGSFQQAVRNATKFSSETTSPQRLETEAAFQEFVAGTFYRNVLKALRATQRRPAYFHGGAAENVFQNQLDQQVAEDLAKSHGETFSGPLFSAFSHALRPKTTAPQRAANVEPPEA